MCRPGREGGRSAWYRLCDGRDPARLRRRHEDGCHQGGLRQLRGYPSDQCRRVRDNAIGTFEVDLSRGASFDNHLTPSPKPGSGRVF
ncbi:hypothetical protein AERO8C_70183 [Aeromonas veronii]|uniref:Uncharacterized protein n=1 Tax=Aeromonas veronii TaxID=654 RepID=A0A653LCL7_AERVE|nr:hypothetical protein AERO8C_70183 [Aeromonas veronii]